MAVSNARMTTWIEHVINPDVWVVGIHASKHLHGQSSLTYAVETSALDQIGRFEEFDIALEFAYQMAVSDRSPTTTEMTTVLPLTGG